jgi:murein DD-endopeptidase MepM/ murein hydrolase activator NlpD
MRTSRVVHGVLLLAAAFTLVPPPVAARPSDLARAEARQRSIRSQLDAATAQFVSAREALTAVDARLSEARALADSTRGQAAAARRLLDRQAAALYVSGGLDLVSAVLSDQAAGDVVQRLELAGIVAERQRDELEAARAVLAGHDAAEQELAMVQATQRALLASRQAAVKTLNARFRQAQALVAERRQAQVVGGRAVARVTGGLACPMAQPRSYTDTWGAARSGGRRHQGTDILAPYGTTVFAIANGVISRAETGRGLGGTVVYLQGDDGTEYFYAHLASFSVREGQRVRAGQPIARNGATGNAADGPPHVHFEVHPGRGAPVNPYPYVRRACG